MLTPAAAQMAVGRGAAARKRVTKAMLATMQAGPVLAIVLAIAIASLGWKEALRRNPHLLAGLNVGNGHVSYAAVAQTLGYPQVAPEAALAFGCAPLGISWGRGAIVPRKSASRDALLP